MAVADEGPLMIFGYKTDTLLIEFDYHVSLYILFSLLLRTMRGANWAVVLSDFIDFTVDVFAFERLATNLVSLFFGLHNYYIGLRINLNKNWIIQSLTLIYLLS